MKTQQNEDDGDTGEARSEENLTATDAPEAPQMKIDPDSEFFIEAFTDPVTREPYEVPIALKRLAIRICRSYGIRGVCDPMYIANVAAMELGLGDGQSNFNT